MDLLSMYKAWNILEKGRLFMRNYFWLNLGVTAAESASYHYWPWYVLIVQALNIFQRKFSLSSFNNNMICVTEKKKNVSWEFVLNY